MTLRSLTPTFNSVSLETRGAKPRLDLYQTQWLGSGTEALAYSLLHKLVSASNTGCFKKPEVIVPGYCCPDLLAAVLYAGCQPIIVDISENDPSYDLALLKEALSEATIAVIAVNFLGISERLIDIQELLQGTGIALIEDNAQWFPNLFNASQFVGDYVTFSFGRGKAISLLGGGLVAIRDSASQTIELKEQNDSRLYPIKAKLFNLLTRPRVYYWFEKLPFLGLGKTEYHPLTAINLMPDQQQRLVTANIQKYWQMNSDNQDALLGSPLDEINLLDPIIKGRLKYRLLRYPLLMDSKEKKVAILKELNKKGLGASAMYETELTQVSGVNSHVSNLPHLPNSQTFANCFLTLPLHQRVTLLDIERMVDIVVNVK